MRFEWDEDKQQSNLRKHGLGFGEAREIFLAPMLVTADAREDYGEDRSIGIGFLRNVVVVIVYTEPAPGITRVISLRKAFSHERKRFESYLRNRLG
ncbi:MAG TPA: BrnT family toxin [Thermoanaerobaculia bacterium]|jgi:uncharacterized DUF497 family protein|nr:BrnT family toxin [Thermoanaerobaculia bacterium]